MSSKGFEKYLRYLFYARFLLWIPTAFLSLTLPEIWRQSDTLGVSLTYYLKVYQPFQWVLFFPSVLQRQNGGFVPMEFPFLNLITSPFWTFGPYVGKAGCFLLLFTLLLFLCRKCNQVWGTWAFYLIPLSSFTQRWFGKFMPDSLSVLLVTLAVGYLRKELSVHFLVLASLGILIKPTSAFVLALMFYFAPLSRKNSALLFFSLLPSLSWYLGVNPWIESHLQEGDGLFAIHLSSPAQTVRDVIDYFPDLLRSLNYLFFPLGWIILIPAWWMSWKSLSSKRLFSILILQFVGLLLISGKQGLTHEYYFASLSPTVALLLNDLTSTPFRKIRLFVFIALVLTTAEIVWMEYKPLRTSPSEYEKYRQCNAIKTRHPEISWNTLAFRTEPSPYPTLGLCFGAKETQRSARFGLYTNTSPIPKECRPVDETKEIKLVQCGESTSSE